METETQSQPVTASNLVAPVGVSMQGPGQPPEAKRDFTLLNVKSNDRLDAEAKAAAQAQAAQQKPAHMGVLAAYIMDKFRAAERAMMMYQTEAMMDALRRRKGVYSPKHMAEIKKQGGSEVFVKVTEAKCLTVEALISEVFNPTSGEKPWNLKPTPKPNLPPGIIGDVMNKVRAEIAGRELELTDEQIVDIAKTIRDKAIKDMTAHADKKAANMSALIEDQFEEGDFSDAIDECISDAVTTGTCIMKGPFLQMERSLQWSEEGNWTPDVMDVPTMKWKRVDPLYFFPSRGSTDCKNASYLTEVDDFTREQLSSMIGIPGWNEQNIRAVLSENPNGTKVFIYTDPERATLENRRSDDRTDPDDLFQGVWYCGECHGQALRSWGITKIKDDEVHEIIALTVGNYVLHARLNEHPLHSRQYKKACYKPVKGSFWGQGVPTLMNDIQDNCNAAARHLVNNLAIASGPQAVIRDVDQMAEGTDITSMYPWKIWQFNDPNRTGKAPLEFFQPTTNAAALMEVFKFFLSQADERVGIPQFQPAAGQGQGAAGTATGLSILLNQTSRVIKMSIRYFDKGIIKPNVYDAFTWNMLHIDDPSIKGDCKVVASGAMGLFVKEQQQLRVAEMLRLTGNPVDLSIMRNTGRAVLLRAGMSGIDVDRDAAVPTEDEMIRREEQEAQLAAQPPEPTV